MYYLLFKHFGPQYWWPGDTRFEICIGAILTQNTNWQNVEKAIENLKRKGLLDAKKLEFYPLNKLSILIKPAGYYNVKAKRLKSFVKFFIKEYNADFDKMKLEKLNLIRNKLLNVYGIGKETADSILLYALDMPVFVVDAYTKRILSRHKIINDNFRYDEIQALFHKNLRRNSKLFNEYHALLVKLGKEYCKKVPVCDKCPIRRV